MQVYWLVIITYMCFSIPDRPMQLNEARFIQNGRCGYVLRPEYMFQDNFDPYDRKSLPANVKACVLSIRVRIQSWSSFLIHVGNDQP